ncbi:Madm_1 protein [Gryllus bimaculatus]|nr:Madm_1 protein [Gryllus bimaculatus]
MPGSRSSNDPDHKSPRESGEDSEDESEILEESPCGRWLKRREEIGRGPNGGKQFFQRGGLHLRLNTRSYQNTANGMEPDLQFLWRLIPNLWLNIIVVLLSA